MPFIDITMHDETRQEPGNDLQPKGKLDEKITRLSNSHPMT
jgi:hypothetical protein